MTCLEQARSFWNSNRLRYLVPLKYTFLYGDVVACECSVDGASFGALVYYATPDIFWDMGMYPTSQYVLIPTASDEAAAQRLCDLVQTRFPAMNLVFKFSEPYTRAVFEKVYPLHYARTLISYTAPQVIDAALPAPEWHTDADVEISSAPNAAVQALYLSNGYSQDELDHSFAKGAQAFTLYEAGTPVCTCMIYQNSDDIWELGGVHTLTHARRRGYARRVVETALATLMQQRRIPRYLVDSTNTASVQLAEQLGLQVALRFEHYRNMPDAL